MNEHKYIHEPLPKLELDKKRFRVKDCPCGKSNKDGKFVPYVGHENKGYCHSCGETYLPELPKIEQLNTPQPKAYMPRPVPPQPKTVSFIPTDIFKASLNITAFETNHFVQFLINLFGVEVASQLVSRYLIATSKHWKGATVFWQIDTLGKIRAGKIMLYSLTTGKRVKKPFDHINWVHKLLKQPEFALKQCFFGEHLLIDKTKPVAIVESEKTAIIASAYFTDFIWLAAGSKDGLNTEKCSILKGRTVLLYPDCSLPKNGKPTAFEQWSSKAKELSHLATFFVSDLLEREASEAERKEGNDIADYLIKHDFREFAKNSPVDNTPSFKSNSQNAYIAFVDKSGILYIPTPPNFETFTRYSNGITAYNKRTEIPDFVYTIPPDLSNVFINLETLTINN